MATKEDIENALQTIIDPELFIDIWTLGLIYETSLNEGDCDIKMTFTSPACPAGPQLVDQVKNKLLALDGIENVNVTIVFDPAWQPSEELKAHLGIG